MRHCLVFDLDDTLVPEYQFVVSGFKEVDKYLKEKLNLSGFFPLAHELFNIGERGDIFNQCLDEMLVEYDAAFIKNLVNVYRTHKPKVKLYDDASWALTCFSESYRLGLITDGYAITQNNKIKVLDIAKKFECIVVSDELGSEYWKPHFKPYLVMQQKLGVTGSECIYVGDNPNKDFISAKKLGWLTVQVNRTNGIYKNKIVTDDFRADYEINSLLELKDTLELYG